MKSVGLELDPQRASTFPSQRDFSSKSPTTRLYVSEREKKGSWTLLLHPSACEEESEATGTITSAVMQVILTCLGIAALSIPHIFAQVGWGLGSAILLVPTTISCISMRQIVLLGEFSGHRGLVGAFSPHLGARVGIFVSCVLFLLFEFIVAACMAIPCDIIPALSEATNSFPGVSKEFVGLVIVVGGAIAGFAKDLSALDKLLQPSILIVVYLMLYVVARACMHGINYEMNLVVWENPARSLSARAYDSLSTAWAAFGAEVSILAITANTAKQFKSSMVAFTFTVVDIPMLSLLCIYFVFGFAGYSEYGAKVEPNLLMTMGSDWWSTIAKIGLSLVNMFRVPLFNVVQWYTLLDLVPGLTKLETMAFGFGRTLVLTCMNALSLGILLLLSDFSKVLGLIGGVFGIPLFTFLPCSAWIAARYRSSPRLLGSYFIMDVISLVMLVPMSIFYAFNLSSYLQ